MFKTSTCKLLFGIAVLVASILFNPLTAQTNIQIDTTFGDKGIATMFYEGENRGGQIERQPDGKILLMGSEHKNFPQGDDLLLYRLLPNGDLDTTFGDSGLVLYSNGRENEFKELSVMQDGAIMIAGKSEFRIPDPSGNGDTIQSDNAFIMRFLPTGVLDSAFGLDGVWQLPLEGQSNFQIVQNYNNAWNIVSGTVVLSDTPHLVVFLMNELGEIDTTFGAKGYFLSDTLQGLYPEMAIDERQRIVMIGTRNSNEPQFFSRFIQAIRLNSNGTLDSTFANNGRFENTYLTGKNSGESLAIQGDGKILLASRILEKPGDFDFLVHRLHMDGSLDESFGNNGFTHVHVPEISNVAKIFTNNISDIYLVGDVDTNTKQHLAVVKLNSNGSIDTAFGNSGSFFLESNAPGRNHISADDAFYINDTIIIGGEHFISTGIELHTTKFVLASVNTTLNEIRWNKVEIYPNPAKNILNINIEKVLKENVEIKLFDQIGQSITLSLLQVERTLNSYKALFSLDNIPKGIYYLQLTSAEFSHTQQIIKQ